MNSKKSKIFMHVVNFLTIFLIVECFLCSLMAVRSFAKDDCFNRVEETTAHMSDMLTEAMGENTETLVSFAGILAANTTNPDNLLRKYMENFCRTQGFSAIYVRRADNTGLFQGNLPTGTGELPPFEDEVKRGTYISDVYSGGSTADKKFIYIAVPVVRSGDTVGMLYGFKRLDAIENYLHTTAYNGNVHFSVIDSKSGDFLLDTVNTEALGNINTMNHLEARDGYDIKTMRDDIRNGTSGFFIFRSAISGKWVYTYYMPTEINSWSIQLTVDEDIAFAGYNGVSRAVMILAAVVIILMFVHVCFLMWQTTSAKKKDDAGRHKTEYMYAVQRALLNAHNNPDFIEQALKSVADEMKCETVLLLAFADRIVNNVYFWPSKDKLQATELLGRNIRDDFPVLFDALKENTGISYYSDGMSDQNSVSISSNASEIFAALDVRNIMLVPIVDNSGILKGALCAVNMAERHDSCDILECVTYDFFMAIANIENHNIIKNMASMDYLTKLKGRNAFESEAIDYATAETDRLWCVFIDVNGLHEMNNTMGHKAGDAMLCAVAEAIKHAYGSAMSYRYGGDEFVAFSLSSTDEEFMRKKSAVIAELAKRGYNVSVGYESAERSSDGIFDVDSLVAAAEAIMYKEKRKYYAEHNISSDRDYLSAIPADTDGSDHQ